MKSVYLFEKIFGLCPGPKHLKWNSSFVSKIEGEYNIEYSNL